MMTPLMLTTMLLKLPPLMLVLPLRQMLTDADGHADHTS